MFYLPPVIFNKSGDFSVQQTSIDGTHFLLSLPQTVLIQDEVIDRYLCFSKTI